MFFRKFLLVSLLTFIVNTVFCQSKTEYKQYRILILLDGSSSMVEQWNEHSTRFRTASDIIMRLMDSVYHFNPNVEFALRVYGHQHDVPEHNCYDTKREVNFSKDNYTQMDLRLASLHPVGVSPIAYSLKTAAEEDFNDSYNYAYSLVLITDGGESCGGDICDVVKTLLEKKIQFKPYIVSLVDYAPLKDQYACLGNYLDASNPQQLNKTIHDIAENYHRILAVPVVKPKLETTPPPIAIKKPEPVPQVTIPTPKKVDTVFLPHPVTQPRVKMTDNISNVKSAPKYRLLPSNNIRPIAPQKQRVAKMNMPAKEAEPVMAKREEIAKVYTNPKLRSFGLAWSTPTLKLRKVPKIALPPKEATPPPPPVIGSASTNIKPAPVRPVATKPVANRTANPKNDVKTATYTIKTEPAQETSLEIFFTDGKGKYYHTSPPVKLVDVKTGKEVKKFYRTVDAQGNPDPQILPSGDFTLVIGKGENFVAKSVTILPNNKNKVTILASNGTLSFKYADNYKKPIEEFTALVKKNFEPGPVMPQPCATQKDYEPGSYHIEVNTNPISRYYIDLDFGYDFIIEIPEPGYVSFTNTEKMGKVTLYYQNGDMFSQFSVLDVNGNPALQKVRLQPGAYEARYKENGVYLTTMEKVVKFFIRSRETTEIFLQ